MAFFTVFVPGVFRHNMKWSNLWSFFVNNNNEFNMFIGTLL